MAQAYRVAMPAEDPDDSSPDIAAGSAPGGWGFPLLPWGAKLAALRIGSEVAGEGALASGLGLRQDLGRSRGSAYNYNWMHGRRHGRQVEVRIGCSEQYFKGLSFGSQKHMREVVWVRVQAPKFELVGERGELRLSDPSPAVVRETVARIMSAPVWQELRMAAGSEGIVSNRPVRVRLPDDAQNGFLADLWLIERICHGADFRSLPDQRPQRSRAAPYGLGRWSRDWGGRPFFRR
jgi:hypothetical protein